MIEVWRTIAKHADRSHASGGPECLGHPHRRFEPPRDGHRHLGSPDTAANSEDGSQR